MSKHWFGINRYWGWYPASWEGWVVLIGMIGSIVSTVFIVDSRSHSISDTLIGIFPFVSLTIAFTMLVASLKGVSPRFGKANKHQRNYSPDFPNAYLLLALLVIPTIAFYLTLKAFIEAAVLLVVSFLLFSVYKNLSKAH